MKIRTIYYLIPISIMLYFISNLDGISSIPTDYEHTSGTVEMIFQGSDNDVVFKLDGQNQLYCVPSNQSAGLNLSELKYLVGQEIDIDYPQVSNEPLKKVSEVSYKGKLIFTDHQLAKL